MTNTPTKKFRELVAGDLSVSGMMRGPTPKAQAGSAMGEIKWQLEYKSQWRHTKLTLAPRIFPSSKICHVCLRRNAKLKRERERRCPSCESRHDRNLNPAMNLRNLILPPGRGPMLRDGRAMAGGSSPGETVSNDRRTAQLSLWEGDR